MNNYSIRKIPSGVSMELAQKHEALRKERKLSREELADRSGVSMWSIKRFETTGQISLESLLKLALILNRLADFDAIFQPQEDKKVIDNLFK